MELQSARVGNNIADDRFRGIRFRCDFLTNRRALVYNRTASTHAAGSAVTVIVLVTGSAVIE